MGKINNTDNPLDAVGLRLQDKRSIGHVILKDKDIKFYVDRKEQFSLKGISDNLDSIESDLSGKSSYISAQIPLDNIKTAFYRNLEGDNQLPTQDYTERTREIQTPIVLISNNGELGDELITDAANRNFTSDTEDWTLTEECSISGGYLNLVSSDGEYQSATLAGILTIGESYLIRIKAIVTDGAIDITESFSAAATIIKNGVTIIKAVATGEDLVLKRSGVTDAKIKNISITAVVDDVVSDDLITNVNDIAFSSDTGFWTKTGTTISNSVANFVSSDGSEKSISRANLLEVGETYWISLGQHITSSGTISVEDSFDVVDAPLSYSVIGKHVFKGVAKSTTFKIKSVGVTNIQLEMVSIVKITNLSSGTYILANVPRVDDFVNNCENWMLYQTSSNFYKTLEEAIKLKSAEYITIGDYDNCLKVTLNDYPLYSRIGGNAFLCTYKDGGINLRLDALQYSNRTLSTSWRRSLPAAAALWKNNDGKWMALLQGDNSTNSPAYTRFKAHLFECDGDLMTGVWTDLSGESATDYITPYLPYGYYGVHQISGQTKLPGKSSVSVIAPLMNSGGSVAAFAWMDVSESGHISFTPITISVESFSTPAVPCTSGAFYKGKYVVAIHDGSIGTGNGVSSSGKRIVVSSKYKEGPYELHSEIFNLTDTTGITYPGSMMSQYVVNGSLFVHNSELYYFSCGAGIYLAEGNYAKHLVYLWKYNDIDEEWSAIVTPAFFPACGVSTNYNENYNRWALNHLSLVTPLFVEDNKLYFEYSATAGYYGYCVSVGYLDITKLV